MTSRGPDGTTLDPRALVEVISAPATRSVPDVARAAVRERLVAALPQALGGAVPGGQLRLDLAVLRRAASNGYAEPPADEPFSWRPSFVRRSLGLAAIDACLDRRFATPAEATPVVADEAVAAWARSGWRTFHWEAWYSALPTGAKASVVAEATTWATSLWSLLDWVAFPTRPTVGGPGDRWTFSGPRPLRLDGRSELQVDIATDPARRPAGPPGDPDHRLALVSVAGGIPSDGWPTELGFVALVAGLRRRSLPVPARIVGLWPESGEHRVLEVDSRALHAAVDRVLTTVGTLSGRHGPVGPATGSNVDDVSGTGPGAGS